MIFFILIVSVSFVSAGIDLAEHPQQYFCTSDYFIVGQTSNITDTPNYTNLTFHLHAYHKISSNSYNMDLLNQTFDLQLQKCDLNSQPKPNRFYVLTLSLRGNGSERFRGDKCEYFRRYDRMTAEEQHGIAGNYVRGCNCRIRKCGRKCKRNTPMECLWPVKNIDLARNATCLQIDRDQCEWTRFGQAISTAKHPLKKRFNVF